VISGCADRLDDIKALHVNTLWLMPIHPIGVERRYGELGSPYSVRDHLAVNPELGTLDDLTTLIDEAHARGISVILDWVANHTAWDHPWITDHPDWYTTDAQGDDRPPARHRTGSTSRTSTTRQAGDASRDDRPAGLVGDQHRDRRVPDRRAGLRAVRLLGPGAPRGPRRAPSARCCCSPRGSRADHHAAGFDLTYGWRFFSRAPRTRSSTAAGAAADRTWPTARSTAPVPPGKRVLRWTTNHDETAYDAPPPVLFGGLDASLAAYASMVVPTARTPLDLLGAGGRQ
jgi:hypothetical protein